MKIQIDTENKIIRLERRVNLKELFDFLEEILPEKWKEFEMESETTINNWSNPIIIKEKKYNPYTYPIWMYDNGTSSTLKSGVFNVNYK